MRGTAAGNAARKVRPGGSALVLAGAGFALLQAAQSLVGSFNPRWEVTVLLAIALPAATFFVQRLRARDGEAIEAGERGERLKQSLRVWPVGRLDDCRDGALGLHPPRRDFGNDYIGRTADTTLQEAIAVQRLVIVVGSSGSGKTRSAIEAVRQALPGDALMVVPRNGAALRELLEMDPELRHLGDADKHRVLWLDGCARYLDEIDADALLRLVEDGDGPGVTVVSTARKEVWEGALAAESGQGEAAKSLLSRATVVELPLELDDRELEKAKALYPGVEFEGGVGKALVSSGDGWSPNATESDAGDDRGEEQFAIDGPGRARDDRLLLFYATVTAAALMAVLGFALVGDFDEAPPPPIADQAREAARKGAAGSRIVTMRERADFGGSEQRSYVFAFGDDPEASDGEERADELQVWDRDGDELEMAFRFEPSEEGVFQFRGADDVDGDGADELVGGYGSEAIPGELLIPFALDWDEDAGEYRLVSLAPDPPLLARKPRDREARDLRGAYESPLKLVDRQEESALSLSGFRAQDFAVTPFPHRLISAYVVDDTVGRESRLIEVKAAVFSMIGGTPHVRPCRLTGQRTLTMRVPDSSARLLNDALLERWLEVSKSRQCAVGR